MNYKKNSYLKSWSKFEIFILLFSIFFIVILGFIFNSKPLTISVAFLGIFCSLNRVKGKVLSQILGIILSILYSVISYQNKYYGEVIIYIFIMLPIYTLGMFSWMKYKNNKTNNVLQDDITKDSALSLLTLNICLFFLLYSLLKHFNTNQLLISSLAMLIKLNAAYLAYKRNKYSFIFYIFSAITLLILWIVPFLKGDYQLLPMIFDAILLIINNIYGFIKWSKSK